MAARRSNHRGGGAMCRQTSTWRKPRPRGTLQVVPPAASSRAAASLRTGRSGIDRNVGAHRAAPHTARGDLRRRACLGWHPRPLAGRQPIDPGRLRNRPAPGRGVQAHHEDGRPRAVAPSWANCRHAVPLLRRSMAGSVCIAIPGRRSDPDLPMRTAGGAARAGMEQAQHAPATPLAVAPAAGEWNTTMTSSTGAARFGWRAWARNATVSVDSSPRRRNATGRSPD
jgi:hypothetical protein